jgi:hypothetical protein
MRLLRGKELRYRGGFVLKLTMSIIGWIYDQRC